MELLRPGSKQTDRVFLEQALAAGMIQLGKADQQAEMEHDIDGGCFGDNIGHVDGVEGFGDDGGYFDGGGFVYGVVSFDEE